jgi:hypothetical protein
VCAGPVADKTAASKRALMRAGTQETFHGPRSEKKNGPAWSKQLAGPFALRTSRTRTFHCAPCYGRDAIRRCLICAASSACRRQGRGMSRFRNPLADSRLRSWHGLAVVPFNNVQRARDRELRWTVVAAQGQFIRQSAGGAPRNPLPVFQL